MRDRRAAADFDRMIGLLQTEPGELLATTDADLRGRVRVARMLAALDLAAESRIRQSLGERLRGAVERRRSRAAGRPGRRPWLLRRPLLATELGVLLVVLMLALVAPQALAALVMPVVRILEKVRVGENTEILRSAPQTRADVASTLEQHRRRIASGKRWHLHTPYGGFGGSVPPGEPASVRRFARLEDLGDRAGLQVPTGFHRDEPVRLDHALVAPGGIVLVFFGSGENELLLAAMPVGEGRTVAYGRAADRRTADGSLVVESPELRTEEMTFAGQRVVWDPDPEPSDSPGSSPPRREASSSSALRWEEDGWSYSLMGRSLTREEAVDLFLSERPIGEVE